MNKIVKTLFTIISLSMIDFSLIGMFQQSQSAIASPKIETKQSIVDRGFVLPSGNIYCLMFANGKKFLRCEIQTMLNPIPRKPYPSYCQEGSWGHGFMLPQRGKPKVLCISDTIFGSYPILNYNVTWQNSGFKCTSRITGLTCSNASGRGFFLSKQKWYTF